MRMPGKKLLYAPFMSATGEFYWTLGAHASDNMSIPSTVVEYDSKDKELDQVGALFGTGDASSSEFSDERQHGLYYALAKTHGYGEFVGILPSNAAFDVPMYLFGQQVRDGVAMPYVKWIRGSYGHAILHYYRSDGTDLGGIFRIIPGGGGVPFYFAGALYDDGTFTGDYGSVRAYTIVPGVYSKKRYYWTVLGHYTNQEIINPTIMADIYEYMPIDPEGMLTGNPDGDFDFNSDEIDFPDMPTLSALDSGMTAMYEMTNTQLQHLSQFLWSPLFDLDTFKKMFNDPMQAILNISIVPVDVTTGGTAGAGIRIGNINTGVDGTRIASPYKIIDFGSINLNLCWGNFADFSPYTKLSIFLPYVGVQQLSIDDVMGGTIQLKAYCDVLTGSVQYVLKSKQSNLRSHGHDSVLYTWGGNCQYQIPLSASNMTAVVNSIISTTTSVAGATIAAVASEGTLAPAAIVGAVGSTASNVANAKTSIQRGGGLGGAVGLFGIQKPYLILERPELIIDSTYDATMGVPNENGDYIKNYTGFVQVKACNLSIPGATAEELSEIDSLLKGGVLV